MRFLREFSLPVWSWALYDFANTIFYGVVVTLYLPNYVIGLSHGLKTPYAMATPPAMIVGALISPALGVLVDRTGRAKRYTLLSTLACALFCCALALPSSALPVLVCYSLALFFYNAGIGFYNAMLPAVSTDRDMARVSGLGVGLGYLGNVFAFPIAALVVKYAGGDPRPAFVLAAILFVLFTMPLLFFCPDPKPKPAAETNVAAGARNAIARHFRTTHDLLRRCLRDKGLLLFFAGNFLCADALNAAYQMMVPFIEDEKGLGIDKFMPMLLINIAAVPAAIGMGAIGDRIGPKPVTIAGAISFLVAVFVPQVLIEMNGHGFLPDSLLVVYGRYAAWRWIAASALVIFGAIGVGGVLGSARKWLCRLTPASEHGAWFGVYGLTAKLSLTGLLVFTILADRRGDYRDSIGFLVIELLVACGLFGAAPAVRREGAAA